MKSRCFFVIIESKSILDLITAMEDMQTLVNEGSGRWPKHEAEARRCA